MGAGLRLSITQRKDLSMNPTVLHAARSYSDAEATRLASHGHLPEVTPDFSPFEDMTFESGFALLRIDPRNKPRIVDVPIGFVIKLAEGFGARLLFNSRTRRDHPQARYYGCLDFPSGLRAYLNRIIKDAQPGFVVRERGSNFRSHLPEDLVVVDAPLRDGPTKHVNGRLDAVEATLHAYDQADAATQAFITRTDLEALLHGLLALADARASERELKRGLAKFTTPQSQAQKETN